MANFQEYGFSGVIPKPYVMEELSRILEEVIRQTTAPGHSGAKLNWRVKIEAGHQPRPV